MGLASVRTRLSMRVAAAGFAALAVLTPAALAGCAGSSPSATPTTLSPGTGSSSATPGQSQSSGPGRTKSPQPRHRRSHSPKPRQSSPGASHSASAGHSAKPDRTRHPAPVVAPATGGGGTAGFQNPLLLAIGGAAILAGAASFAYRRRVIRHR